MSQNTLAVILTTERLLQLAGNRFFQRGQDYFEHGQVAKLTKRHGVVKGFGPWVKTLHGETVDRK